MAILDFPFLLFVKRAEKTAFMFVKFPIFNLKVQDIFMQDLLAF